MQTCQHREISKQVIPRARPQHLGQGPKGHSLRPWWAKVEARGRGGGGVFGERQHTLSPPARGSMIFHCFGHRKRSPLNKKCQLWMTQVPYFLVSAPMCALSRQTGHAGFVLKRESGLLQAGQLASLHVIQIITGPTANPTLYTVSLQVTYFELGRTPDST